MFPTMYKLHVTPANPNVKLLLSDVNVTMADFSSPVSSDTWANGNDAYSAFQADASLKAKYLGIQGGASVDYSIQKAFSISEQVYLFSYLQRLLIVSLDDYFSYINVGTLKGIFSNIKPWDSTDTTIVNSYKDLFSSLGSHAIIGATYGSALNVVSHHFRGRILRADVL